MENFEIDDDNLEIWSLLSSISNQLRISNGVVYALDYTPILLLAKEFSISIDDSFVKKLRAYEQVVLNIIKNGSDICTDEDKKKCKIQYGGNFKWACDNCQKNLKNRLNKDKENGKRK